MDNIQKYICYFSDGSITSLRFDLNDPAKVIKPEVKDINYKKSKENFDEYSQWLQSVVLPDLVSRFSSEQLSILSLIGENQILRQYYLERKGN